MPTVKSNLTGAKGKGSITFTVKKPEQKNK
jgi:hypothetical protein